MKTNVALERHNVTEDENPQRASLDWISAGLSDSISETLNAIESYLAGTPNPQKLGDASAQLAKIEKTLRDVSIPSAALLAQHLIELSQLLAREDRLDQMNYMGDDNAFPALYGGVTQLSNYLETLKKTHNECVSSVLSVVNDIRAVSGQQLLVDDVCFDIALPSAEIFFHDQWQDLLTSNGEENGVLVVLEEAKKLSQVIFLDPDFDATSTKLLSKCCSSMLKFLAVVAEKDLDARQSISSTRDLLLAIKVLLNDALMYRGRLSLSAKAAIKNYFFFANCNNSSVAVHATGEVSVPSMSEQLLREMLFCVAASPYSPSPDSKPAAKTLADKYQFNGALDGQIVHQGSGQFNSSPLAVFKLGTPEIATLDAIFGSLRRDVTVLKQAVEQVMSSDLSDNLGSMQDLARTMKYTLELLERDALAALSDSIVLLFKQTEGESQLTSADPSSQLLADLAEKLEALDAGLHCEQFGSRRSEAELAALDQSKQTLLRIRENLVARKESGHGFDGDALLLNFDPLDKVADLLVQTRGALKILQIEEGVVALSACHQRFRQQRANGFDDDTVSCLISVLSTMITFLEAAKFCQQDKLFNQLKSQLVLLDPSLVKEWDAISAAQLDSQPADALPSFDSSAVSEALLDTAKLPAADLTETVEVLEGITLVQAEQPAVIADLIPLQNPIDDEIAEIFLEEAGEVIDDIDKLEQSWADTDSQSHALTELRRAYHTLKGSGRMAGAEHIGDLAWAMEHLLNRICNNAVTVDESRTNLIDQANRLLPSLVTAFAQRVEPAAEPLANVIAAVSLSIEDHSASNSEAEITEARAIEPTVDQMIVDSVVKPTVSVTSTVSAIPTRAVTDADTDVFDKAIPLEQSDDTNDVDGTTIAGTNDSRSDDSFEPREGILPEEFQTRDRQNKDQLAKDQQTKVSEGLDAEETVDSELQAIFITELGVQLSVVGEYIEAYSKDSNCYPYEAVERAFHTLLGSARVAGNAFVASLAQPLECLAGSARRQASISLEHHQLITIAYHYLCDSHSLAGAAVEIPNGFIDTLALAAPEGDQYGESSASVNHCFDDDIVFNAHQFLQQWRVSGEPPIQLAAMESGLAQIENAASEGKHSEVFELSTSLLNAYRVFSVTGLHYQAYAAMANGHLELENLLDCVAAGQELPHSTATNILSDLVEVEQALVAQAAVNVDSNVTSDTASAVGLDQEIVETFLDECEDLIEELESGVQHWLKHRTDMSYLQSLLRPLHTIKGGARMAGLDVVGNVSHEFETLLQSASNGDAATDDDFFDRIRISVCDLTESINQVSSQLTAVESGEQASGVEAESVETKVEDEKRNTEMVRVSADLLEDLVNLAGETSISRSLVEEQLSDLAQNIEEIDSTVERLKEQLRRLEIETQAQIAFRKEQVESAGSDGFDPLEMDRYSQVQQLSKSLLESASDLTDLKGTLSDKNRDMETLLLQQSRINTSLQEGLMQTRTVPISRYLTPRLRRIVRQVSGELDKPVAFDVQNAGGELDRSMIERVVAPLEHVLRNAIDHGIESLEQRRQLGKSDQGLVSLSIRREGSDVLLSLSDDGSGIDVDAVRSKAIDQGLMTKDEVLSADEIMQFIFAPGFSTAKSITQISGRGVGMDVVQSEIRELGGSIQLRSQLGSGTEFIFRLPFTVSMNRALMVSAAGETLAVPLDSIEGIVRVSPYELQEYYGDNAADFFYAGQRYDFTYLGSLINGSDYQVNSDMLNALPVLLVRGGDRFVALQVDKLLGSREIVVKSLGAQFAQLDGIAGATLLGDGSVVMIADLVALVRSGQRVSAQVIAKRGGKSKERLTAMVVDDSVTVRKVTTRLLERKDIDVRTAKDGLEAMALLEEVIPDFILLDIEMPRMDGFEVVARVRKDERFKDIPVIMITSRAGEKHKERAFELGANQFLGKPYQEEVLFSAIDQVLPDTKNQQRLALH